MNWQENVRFLAQLAGDAAYEEDPDFLAIMPQAIQFAENLIFRDLDLLSTRVVDNSGSVTQNSRVFVLPTEQGSFIVLESIQPKVDGVYLQPLLPTSPETIDMLWPSDVAPSNPSVPAYWAPLDQASVKIGPAPDRNYQCSCRGTVRPAALDPKSTSGTFISNNLTDLFIAAEAEFLIGAWQKGWNAQAGAPSTAQGWQQEYQRRMQPALVQECRAKLQANGWTDRLPSPIATPAQS